MQHHATTSQYELIEQRGDAALAGRSIVATKHNHVSNRWEQVTVSTNKGGDFHQLRLEQVGEIRFRGVILQPNERRNKASISGLSCEAARYLDCAAIVWTMERPRYS